MEVTITNKFEGGQFSAIGSGLKLSGNYRKNPDNGKLTQFDANVNTVNGQDDESYIGSVNAYTEGDKLKYNLNNIALEHLVSVVGAIGDLVDALEASIEE